MPAPQTVEQQAPAAPEQMTLDTTVEQQPKSQAAMNPNGEEMHLRGGESASCNCCGCGCSEYCC